MPEMKDEPFSIRIPGKLNELYRTLDDMARERARHTMIKAVRQVSAILKITSP